MKNVTSLNCFCELTSGSIHDVNDHWNLIFHMSNILSPIEVMVYDYTELFDTASFLKTSIIHCNINRIDYFHLD